MIAGFIFLRLRGILGKRTGYEGKAPGQFKEILKNVNVQKPKKVNQTFDDEAKKDLAAAKDLVDRNRKNYEASIAPGGLFFEGNEKRGRSPFKVFYYYL